MPTQNYASPLAVHIVRCVEAFVLVVLLALLGCGWSHAADPGLTARPATTPYLNVPPSPPIPNGSFTAAIAFPNLTFQGAVAVRPVPGTNLLWVLEREGRIYSFEDDPAATTKTLVLDLNAAEHQIAGTRWWCQGWDDSGLMGIAFHPQFGQTGDANERTFFLCYQARDEEPEIGTAGDNYRPLNFSYNNDIPGCFNRLAKFTLTLGAPATTVASEVVLIDQPDRHLWHNGGDLLFGNDGFLYLLNGDEGRADDYYDRTQRVGGAFFGGVWRIDVDGPRSGISKAITHQPRKRNLADVNEPAPFTGNYGIPLDNPWVGLTGVLEEFWAIGLRSPHRMTIDPPTGKIIVGDIGQGAREELNVIVKGGNYQWAYKEGHKNNRSDRQPPDYTVASTTNSGAASIPLANTASITGNGLSPGLLTVGDLVRFTNHTDLYTITAVSGYPHTTLTITPALTNNVPAGTTLRRTTGLTVAGIGTSSTGTNAPNDYGKSEVTISGSSPLALGDVIAFPGLGGSHQVIDINGTTITIRPGFASSPSVTPPTNGTFLDRLTVFGNEQPPLMDFAKAGGLSFNSIIGGYVYRGSVFPELTGSYFFGNNGSGLIVIINPNHAALNTMTVSDIPAANAINLTGPVITRFNLPSYDGGANGYRGLGGFGLDHNGEPLLCVMQAAGQATNLSTGRLWKIIRSSSSVIGTPIPTDLKDTGAFTIDGDGTVTSMTPVGSLIPYEVNAPLWSDAAHKARWVAIPDGTTIDFTTTDHWTFPEGTVFVKHFELTINEQSNTRRRLETRLLVRSPGGGVYGVTYKWNAGGTQATLVADAGVSEAYTITGPDGVTTRSHTWNYPSRNDCLSCHNSNAGYVLGVNTRQLNGDCTYPSTGNIDNQLHTWASIGLFDTPPVDATIPALPRLANIADGSATPEKRVRSWIDSNCSHCHRPGGVHAFFDARFDTPLRQQNIVDGVAMIGVGLSNPKIIARGAVASSVMHHRDNSLDSAIKMPPLAKNLVDTEAIGVMATWINSLPYSANPVLGSLTRTYNGAPQTVSANATTDGIPTISVRYEGVSVTYPLSTTAPTDVGTYTVTANLDTDLLYSGSTSGTLTIAPASATVAITGLTPTYNGSPKAVTVNTTPSGLPVTITYAGSATAPTNAGSYAVVATVTDPNYSGSSSGTLVIGKATATVTLANLTPTYDGTAKSATATTNPTGRTVTFTYAGSATAPTNAGTYAVVATITDTNYQGSATGNLVIGKATATIALANLTPTYDGTAKSATATTNPTGRTVTITYAGSATAPTNAGTYAVVATITDTNYQGSATDSLVIGKATATIAIANLTPTYDGTPKSATATTNPTGRTVTFTYAGSATAPTNAGTYAVVATISDANYQGSATGSLVISQAVATVTLQHLTQTFDGSPKAASVVTTPLGLTTIVTYDGGATAPSALDTYAVVATVNDANYAGSANGTLTITSQPVLSVAAVAAPEGDSDSGTSTSSGTLTAVLSTASTSTITVAWAASAGTADGADFTAVSGTLTFAPGDLSKPITIPISGDTAFEADETVIVTFSDPQLVALDATTAVLTITNDDANSAPVIAEGAAAAVTSDEDNAPTAFALTLHASDIDAGQALTWSIVTAANHGNIAPLGSGTTQTIDYQPTVNFSGADSFTVQVADAFGGTATCTVTVTIAPRNDPPTLTTAPVVTLAAPVTATVGTWSDATDTTPGTITTALQWQRADDALGTNLIDLTGEISTSHTLTAADLGKYLRVRVTASDDGEGLPAMASTVAYADFVLVPNSSGGGSGGAGSSGGGGGGGCGLGGSVASLLALALLMLRRTRLS